MDIVADHIVYNYFKYKITNMQQKQQKHVANRMDDLEKNDSLASGVVSVMPKCKVQVSRKWYGRYRGH